MDEYEVNRLKDNQQAFMDWLRSQLQPSGTEFTLGNGNTLMEVEGAGRAGIDALTLIFDDGVEGAISISVGPAELEY